MLFLAKKIKILFFFVLIFSLNPLISCWAQTSASQLQRSQEILQQEEALRKKLEEPEKVFIKNIIVKGVVLLNEEKIKEITTPFLKHWLTPTDIRQIIELIKQAYREKGYLKQPAAVSHQIKRRVLIITVLEGSQ